MAYINPSQSTGLPNLKSYLVQNLPEVTKRKRVYDAFVKWSGIGANAGTSPNTLGAVIMSFSPYMPPEVLVKPIPDAHGMFQMKIPNRILLDKPMVDYYENNACGDAELMLEAVVLHELIHFARFKFGLPDPPWYADESGKAFEIEAYGKVIGTKIWFANTSKTCAFKYQGFD
jgi:hypothetical protein